MKRTARDRSFMAEVVPWQLFVRPRIIYNKHRALQQSWQLQPHDLDAKTDMEVDAILLRANYLFKRLGTGWSVFFEARRTPSIVYPCSTWTHPVAQLIDQERHESFTKAGKHFESFYYLTLCYELPRQKPGWFGRFFFDESPETEAQFDAYVEFFQSQVLEIEGLLRSVFHHVRALDDADTLQYLHSTISFHEHPVRDDIPMYLDRIGNCIFCD